MSGHVLQGRNYTGQKLYF